MRNTGALIQEAKALILDLERETRASIGRDNNAVINAAQKLEDVAFEIGMLAKRDQTHVDERQAVLDNEGWINAMILLRRKMHQ